jgi:hypothetical protein
MIKQLTDSYNKTSIFVNLNEISNVTQYEKETCIGYSGGWIPTYVTEPLEEIEPYLKKNDFIRFNNSRCVVLQKIANIIAVLQDSNYLLIKVKYGCSFVITDPAMTVERIVEAMEGTIKRSRRR